MNPEELKKIIFNPTKEQTYMHSKNFAYMYANLYNFYDKNITINKCRDFYRNIIYFQNLTKLQQEDFDILENINVIRESKSVYLNTSISSEIFATFHLGSYRILNSFLTKKGVDITLLVDDEVFTKQASNFIKSWKNVNDYYKNGSSFQIINAEQSNSFRKIMKAIKDGSNLIIYLDGNTGAKKNISNENLLKIPFLNGNIFCRVGVCYLSLLLKKKITPVLSYVSNETNIYLHFFNKLDLIKENEMKQDYIVRTMNNLYNKFIFYLKMFPSQWEGWIYMQKWIDPKKYSSKCNYQITDNNLEEYIKTNSKNIFPFTIGENYFFLNKITYLGYKININIYKKIEKTLSDSSYKKY